jgi:hypothetical protein
VKNGRKNEGMLDGCDDGFELGTLDGFALGLELGDRLGEVLGAALSGLTSIRILEEEPIQKISIKTRKGW